jgi:hypothetical protein
MMEPVRLWLANQKRISPPSCLKSKPTSGASGEKILALATTRWAKEMNFF